MTLDLKFKSNRIISTQSKGVLINRCYK